MSGAVMVEALQAVGVWLLAFVGGAVAAAVVVLLADRVADRLYTTWRRPCPRCIRCDDHS